MRMWAKVGLIFVVVVVVAVAVRGRPEVSINCSTKGGSGECVIDNKGNAAGNFETDVILVCRDGEHKTHVSARVEAHNHVTKIIDGFEPSVGFLTTCAGLDYRNLSVN